MPKSKANLLSTAQPASQTLRLRVDELVAVIVKAEEAGKNGEEMLDVLSRVEPQAARRPPKVEESHSVAAFIPRPSSPAVQANTTAATPSSMLPLRSTKSTFWGPAFAQSNGRSLSTVSNISLTVPLPPLNADIFANPAEIEATPQKAFVPSSPIPTPVSAEQEQEEGEEQSFILKQLGKKRKRNDQPRVLDGMAAQSDEVGFHDDEESERLLREKAERKRERKDAKRAAKAVLGSAEAMADDDGDEPFDYASAPSILNPPRESKDQMRARRKKEVNPYAKSMDAPKGLPRAQRERGGRSMTYQ